MIIISKRKSGINCMHYKNVIDRYIADLLVLRRVSTTYVYVYVNRKLFFVISWYTW